MIDGSWGAEESRVAFSAVYYWDAASQSLAEYGAGMGASWQGRISVVENGVVGQMQGVDGEGKPAARVWHMKKVDSNTVSSQTTNQVTAGEAVPDGEVNTLKRVK